MTATSKNRRDALLAELESIRTMLDEDSHGDNIPLLIPEDHSKASDKIPVLSVIAIDAPIAPAPAAPIVDPLQAIRQAAAKVVANTERQRNHKTPPQKTQNPTTPAVSDREKLVDDIVRSALPRLESLLRELVQEALLQEKLRGGKR
ncbi:MAG TPA: hypothetical protein VLB90_08835 [Pseudomonadales bacterium]|nr:hypothetical protein [Pseudomonadales bacterium]